MFTEYEDIVTIQSSPLYKQLCTNLEERRLNDLPNKYYEVLKDAECKSEMTVKETASLFYNWCQEQSLDYFQLLCQMYLILRMYLPKKNVFCFYGASNSGKTFWLEKTLLQYPGKVVPSSQPDFMWGPCADGLVIMMNELPLVTQKQIDTFKIIGEGIAFTTPAKFAGDVVVKRKPIFMTNNDCPWMFTSLEHAKAIQNRMYAHHLPVASDVLEYHCKVHGDCLPNTDFFVNSFQYIEDMDFEIVCDIADGDIAFDKTLDFVNFVCGV